MSEDFSRTYDISVSNQMAYAQINELLNKEGSSLANYPNMDQEVIEFNIDNNTINPENNENLRDFAGIGQTQYSQLNAQQQEIVDIVLNTVENALIRNNYIYIYIWAILCQIDRVKKFFFLKTVGMCSRSAHKYP